MLALSSRSSAWARLGSLVALAAVVLIAASLFVPLPDVWGIWPVIGVANTLPKIFILSAAIFAVMAWPKRAGVLAQLRQETNEREILTAATTCTAAVLLALLVRPHLLTSDSSEILAVFYAAATVVAFVAFTLVAAPLSFWRAIAQSHRSELILSLAFGVFGFIAAEVLDRERDNLLSEETWGRLSDVTLQLSYWILKLFDGSAFMDPSTRVLGANDFSVKIYAACSGYEGIILISVFLAVYTLIFRRSLRFPNVLILFPVAMGAIWLLNGLRIALLVFIGANFSPKIALDGFHSQFGWISFLLVAITFMTCAQRISFFSSGTRQVADQAHAPIAASRAAEQNPALLYLVPFIAMLAAQILISTAAPHEHILYPIKVVAIAAALFVFRNAYVRIWSSPALSSVLLGALAGALWIATDARAGEVTPLATWATETTPLVLAVWLVFRAVGTIVMVPIAEELAFRGYLYRLMFSVQFEKVDPRSFGIVALIVSSLLFGLMHERWLSGALAGLLYALLMIRSGRLSDAIAAHMTTNAVIFAWAVAAGQWSLL
jgi:exosortase E/protease (VPEID-CTERM system)